MENFELNWQNDKFIIVSGLLGALSIIAALVVMIAVGFQGAQVFWLILAAGIVGVSYLVLTKTVTKYVAGLAYLALTLGGAFVNLLINLGGFPVLMSVFLFVTMIGLFGYFFIEKDDTILKITAGAAGLFALCHILPFGPDNNMPLNMIFKASFINMLLGLAVFLAAVAVAIFTLLDILNSEVPVETDLVYKLSFYTLLLGTLVAFFIVLFRSPTFGFFMMTLGATIFMWTIGIVAGLSFYIMKEGQEERVLSINFKL